jgi:hypothetical protein
MRRFTHTYLDPASRLGEILFGMIMVLTVTLAAGFAVPDTKAGVRELLIAAIGCNVAWGIIDAVMYLMNCITVRAGKLRLVQAVQSAPTNDAAINLVQNEVEPELQELLDPEEAREFIRSVLTHVRRARLTRTILTRDDLLGSLACFWLVFVSCLPAALPFLFFSRPMLALRVSNFLLVALLFAVGQKWAQYAGTNRLATGGAMVAIGLVLVGLAILLGG